MTVTAAIRNDVTDRQRDLARQINARFYRFRSQGPLEPAGPFSGQVTVYRAVEDSCFHERTKLGLAFAFSRLQWLDDGEHGWLLSDEIGAVGFVTEPRYVDSEATAEAACECADLGAIGLCAHIFPRDASTWTCDECDVVAVLIDDPVKFFHWSEARERDVWRARELLDEAAYEGLS